MNVARTSFASVLTAVVLVTVPPAPLHGALAAQGRTVNPPPLTMLVEAMTLVARQVPVQTLDAQLDQFVQNVPAAQRLGTRWNASDPAFKKARRVVLDRIDRIGATYAKSGDLGRALDAEIKRVGADAETAIAALNVPAGPLIVRQLAMINFTSSAMPDGPNAPKPGDPAFFEMTRSLRTIFESTVGPQMPKDDGTHTAEATQFLSTPSQRVLMRLCTVVVGKAVAQMQGAINLMMFDERQTIAREIEAIIGTVK